MGVSYLGMSVLREYAIAAYFTCLPAAFFAYFTKCAYCIFFPHKLAFFDGSYNYFNILCVSI